MKTKDNINDELTVVGVVLTLLVTLVLAFQSSHQKSAEVDKVANYYFTVSHWYSETLQTNKQLRQETQDLKVQLAQSEARYNKLLADTESIQVLIQIKDDLLQAEIKKKKQ